MNKKRFPLLGGFLAASVLSLFALGLAACGGGNNADNVLGVGGNSGGNSGTITAGNGNTGGNSGYAAISGSNTQAITVYDPNFSFGYVNEPMVSVDVCVPGTTQCEVINDVLLDTGSYGLRLIASTVSLNLPGVQVNSNPIAECTDFATAFDWGPVVQADVKLGDGSTQHTAAAVPIQLMGSSSYGTVPGSCSGGGLIETDTVSSFGANGVLGLGVFAQDCGAGCAPGAPSTPNIYFSCPTASTCTTTLVPVTSQVANPVPLMPADNNGVIVSLPSVATTTGAITVNGTLVLGIGTAANNGLGSAQTFTTNTSGNFTVTYNSKPYSGSFLDTGSNAFYILDATTLGTSDCASGTNGDGFYCPANTTNFSVTTTGANSTSTNIGFSVANGTLLADTGDAVFNDLAAPYGTTPEEFDLGLPFFLGRNVYVGFESLTSPNTGMYWAY